MREARRKLEDAQRRGAAEEQQQAVEELKQAKAALEEILRQLREEEIERVLAQLEGRFRKMLQQEIEVYEGTIGLDGIPDRPSAIESWKSNRANSAANRLQIPPTAEKLWPCCVKKARRSHSPNRSSKCTKTCSGDRPAVARQRRPDDARHGAGHRQIAGRNGRRPAEGPARSAAATSRPAIGSKPPGKGSPAGGQNQDQPLVNAIAELKMIRDLQIRVNTRTERYSQLLERRRRTGRPARPD